jgi:hypothetical protein
LFNIGAGVDALLQLQLPPSLKVVRLDDAGMSVQMAEYVCHAVIRHFREFDGYDTDTQAGKWSYRKPNSRADFAVGVMGLGVLGERVAKALQVFEFPVNGYSRSPKSLEGVRCFSGTQALPDFLAATRVLVNLMPLTPETEMFQGHGFAITGRLRGMGAQPSLGVDLESCISGDMFTVARMALATQRAMDNDESRREAGKLPDTSSITCREALGWITIEGAKMLKMEDRIGSLSPGKQADVVIVRADALNMWPVHDPVLSLITQASVANIETVLVAGEYRKKNNKLRYRDLDAKKQQLLASGHRILSELGLAPAA